MQDLEMFQNVVVNGVVAWRFGEHHLLQPVGEGNAQSRKCDVALIPHGDRSLAISAHDDVAAVVDTGHALVSTVEFGPASDVRSVPIGKDSGHNQLLFSVRAKGCLA